MKYRGCKTKTRAQRRLALAAKKARRAGRVRVRIKPLLSRAELDAFWPVIGSVGPVTVVPA